MRMAHTTHTRMHSIWACRPVGRSSSAQNHSIETKSAINSAVTLCGAMRYYFIGCRRVKYYSSELFLTRTTIFSRIDWFSILAGRGWAHSVRCECNFTLVHAVELACAHFTINFSFLADVSAIEKCLDFSLDSGFTHTHTTRVRRPVWACTSLSFSAIYVCFPSGFSSVCWSRLSTMVQSCEWALSRDPYRRLPFDIPLSAAENYRRYCEQWATGICVQSTIFIKSYIRTRKCISTFHGHIPQ